MNSRAIQVNGVVTASDLPVCDYSVNPYVGCGHEALYGAC